MTPEEHNKYVAIAHLVHAGLSTVMMLGVVIFLTMASKADHEVGPLPDVLPIIWVFGIISAGLVVAPSFVAAYALLKRKSWAKVAGLVAAVLASSSAPIGTGVCVYTFWFLLSEPGKLLYDRPQYALPPRNANYWTDQSREREVTYIPPPSPPDWR